MGTILKLWEKVLGKTQNAWFALVILIDKIVNDLKIRGFKITDCRNII